MIARTAAAAPGLANTQSQAGCPPVSRLEKARPRHIHMCILIDMYKQAHTYTDVSTRMGAGKDYSPRQPCTGQDFIHITPRPRALGNKTKPSFLAR